MLFEQLGTWVSSKRCPPQFSIHTTTVNLIGHTAHIAIATRETVVGLPIALSDLETIVHIYPLEAEFCNFIQCTNHLIDGEGTLVTPCTPYWLKSLWLGSWQHNTCLLLHHLRESAERVEVVTLVLITESSEGVERITCIEFYRPLKLITQRHSYLILIALPLYRHRDHAQNWLNETDSYTAITLPQVKHRNTASVVGVVHTQIVLLLKALCNRQYPVETTIGRGWLQ